MRNYLVYILLSLCFFSLRAQPEDSLSLEGLSNQEIFNKGNESYKADQYQEAIEFYQTVLDRDVESAELYFNMANAFFKQNDLPNSILYYEKARKLDPIDEDINTNLEIANLKTIDKVEGKPALPFSDWWTDLLNTNLVDEWAKKSIYMSFLSLLFMLSFLFGKGLLKKISFFTALLTVFISVLFFVMGQQQKIKKSDSKEAIIFSPSVTVKGSPENDGTRLFVIHEGTKVQILEEFEDWSEISLMNGNKGWLKTETFKKI